MEKKRPLRECKEHVAVALGMSRCNIEHSSVKFIRKGRERDQIPNCSCFLSKRAPYPKFVRQFLILPGGSKKKGVIGNRKSPFEPALSELSVPSRCLKIIHSS